MGFEKYTNMSPELFRDIFKFVTMHATEFMFENQTFKMIKGLPMGAPTSPALACLVTNFVLLNALAIVEPVTFICKYVDDILLVTNRNNAMKLFNILNQHKTLKFKIEEENNDNDLRYLDITVHRSEGQILMTRWDQREYCSNRLVNWYSYHEKHIITQTAINFISNMFDYSDPIYHDDINYLAHDILNKNSFPLAVANDIINNITNGEYTRRERELPRFVGTIAPIGLLNSMNSEISKVTDGSIKLVNKSHNTFLANEVFSHRKTADDFEYKNHLVLKLSCKSCKFITIAPVVKPICLFTILNYLDHKTHPYFDIKMHLNQTKHKGFDIKIIRECQNKSETLRLAEIEAKTNGLNLHAMARNSIAGIVLRSILPKKYEIVRKK